MPGISIGSLRDRVQIQSLTNTTDEGGGNVQSWTTFATVWANVLAIIRRLSTSEPVEWQQVTSQLHYQVEMRYREDVKPQMRLLWGDHTLRIDSVRDPDGMRRRLMLMCLEVEIR